MNKRKIILVFIIALYFWFNFSDICYAADPALINKLNQAFQKIENYIVKLATPVAAIAMGSRSINEKV